MTLSIVELINNSINLCQYQTNQIYQHCTQTSTVHRQIKVTMVREFFEKPVWRPMGSQLDTRRTPVILYNGLAARCPCDLDLGFDPFAHLHTTLDSVQAKFPGNGIRNSGRKPRDKNLLTNTRTDNVNYIICLFGAN